MQKAKWIEPRSVSFSTIRRSDDPMIRWPVDPVDKFTWRSDSVQRRTATKVELLEARHTGVRRQVDAMFEFVFSVPTIAAALQAQYGEPISQAALRRYPEA